MNTLSVIFDDAAPPPPPPPSEFIELGDLRNGAQVTKFVTLTAPDAIVWYRGTFPAATPEAGYVDIYTFTGASPDGTMTTDITDPEIGVYDNFGNLVANNDDSNSLMSMLSFGYTGAPRPAPAVTQPQGQSGPVAEGVYWIAVGRFNVDFFPANFNVDGTYTGAQTMINLQVNTATPTSSLPPVIVVANPPVTGPAYTVLLRGNVTAGVNPASTGITAVVNASAVGGPASVALNDAGTNGDEVAGDGTYSSSFVVPESLAPGIYQLPVTVSDAQSRSSNATFTLNVSAPTNPTIFLQANPGVVVPGNTTLVTATVGAGNFPASTSLAVSADLSAFGGPSSQQLFNDGTNGDVTAGDNIFSFSYTIPANAAGGDQTVTATVSDAQSRSATDDVVVNVATPAEPPANFVDAGTLRGNADGSEAVVVKIATIENAGDIRWIRFIVANDVAGSSYLDIDTFGTEPSTTVGALGDSEIGVYTSIGLRVADDDDDSSNFNSQLSFGAADPVRPSLGGFAAAGNGRDGNLAAGTYYLAVGCFNMVFGPSQFAVTTNNAAATGDITVNFRTNLPNSNACSTVDIGTTGGVPGQDRLLNNNDFVVFIDYFFSSNPIADIGITGGVPGTDGLFNNNDFVVFIDRFFTDQANCTG